MPILNKSWYAKLHVILAVCGMQWYAYSVYQCVTYMYIKMCGIAQGVLPFMVPWQTLHKAIYRKTATRSY